jgi:hypothetical protein
LGITVTVAVVSVPSLLETGAILYRELFVSALKGRRLFEMRTADDRESDKFPPEKRLEVPNTYRIKAGIATTSGVSVPD